MQFINSKQAYPILLGIAVSVLAIGVWQKFSPQTERYAPQSPAPVAIAPSKPSPNVTTITSGQGTLRVGNLTPHPIRIVLQSRANASNISGSEPVSWDFVPNEGGDGGLQLSLPQARIEVSKGDIIFAFATDGSRIYWGPNVVGESGAVVWQGDRREWSFILK